jgi:hypothetical protein
MSSLSRVVHVLCRYDERGQGQVHREGNCAFWFESVSAWKSWVKDRPQPEKFYAYPLRNLSAQRDHLKHFKKDGITAVRYPDGRTVPIDDLIGRIQAESLH